jgi:TnpA family transposase
LAQLEIDHPAHGGQLLVCVKAILHYQSVRMKTIAVSALDSFSGDNIIPIDWVKESWHSILYDDSNRRIKNRFMDRDNFELCVLNEFARRFQSGNLYVGNRTKYDQTARSIPNISRKQVAYLNLNHTRQKDLALATEDVINMYNKYELPRYWGSGSTASVDGTRFDMYEQNIMSEYHLRYASYGGIGYYLVSDKYIALFSRFIPCGVREALHLLDGILENTSDIQPKTIHGDTHAQSTFVFGLAHLLGIKLMPRIKDINSLIFFKPDGRSVYPNIDSLFSENINYALIADNYKEMLRVAVSVAEGKVSASTMIRRLGSNSIRNSLFYAFRELGRVVRTQFLLEYISEVELRESVHAATCKSGEFNQFVQWIFFYNNGMIQENLRHAQDKMIAYNHLVANLLIMHNVDAMSKAINKLKRQGFQVDAEALSSLSPYIVSQSYFLS